ncbi:hypothetical protein [Actinomycetia phage DSL-LC01]|nr:hypothetical protein [Actinomycetia phage DSL-LC01]
MKILVARCGKFIAWLVLGSAGYIFAATVIGRRRKKKEDERWSSKLEPLLGTVYPKDHHGSERKMKYNG